MRAEPPVPLIALLERLRLATAAQVRAEHPRVQRLARDLPAFESVWVDALAQARLLTPFQAAEINAGRGDDLQVGPYVLYQRLAPAAAWEWYLARDLETSALMRIAVFPIANRDAQELLRALERLVVATSELDSDHLAPALRCGTVGDRAWVVCRHVEGPTAASWLVEHGRLPPEVVLEIARQTVAQLARLEAAGECHGDLNAGQLVFSPGGRVVLLLPGLRGILRPAEGYAHAELPPEAYEGLAPERVERGTPPSVASDLFACGCLWWHLLAGRSPLAGGNGLAKVKAAHAARIDDVTRIAPETPQPLASAIVSCTAREPHRRPESFARLATSLGPALRTGRAALASCLARMAGHRVRVRTLVSTTRWSDHVPVAVAAVAGCLVTLAVITWPEWSTKLFRATTQVASRESATPVAPAKQQRLEHPAALAPLDAQRSLASKPATSSQADSGGGVVPASATLPLPAANDHELLLPTDRPLVIASFELRPGQTVRGVDGARPMVVVPAAGLTITSEDVRFEGVDFVLEASSSAEQLLKPRTILKLHSWHTTFSRCSFQAADRDAPTTALTWQPDPERSRSVVDLPTGVLRFEDCVFSHLAAAIEQRSPAALSVEFTNTLCLGPGALLRLRQFPGSDEPVTISMSHTTLREAGALVECQYETLPEAPGQLTIHATDCALFPAKTGAVLLFAGAAPPDVLLPHVAWTGQGSVVGPLSAMLAWLRTGATRALPLSDSQLEVAGLVRNAAGFAGGMTEGPGASRIVRWQVPLHSADPPGVREAGLSLPDLSGTRR